MHCEQVLKPQADQKIVRQLALSLFTCPKEPVFEDCLIGICDGARSFLLAQAQILQSFDSKEKNENINMT